MRTKDDWTHIQRKLNEFTEHFPKLRYAPLRADGRDGPLTRKRIREAKLDLGYLRKNINSSVDENFLWRLDHPFRVNPKRGQTQKAVNRGKRRRRDRRRHIARNRLRAYLKPGVGFFDGVPVAKTFIPVLTWCRQNGWHGRLVSGYRTPAYSESLCYRMCGRPSCPGRCAGRSTNHAYATPERFAGDVSDYYNFGRIVARCPLRPKVHNSLGARDPVHFSPQGN